MMKLLTGKYFFEKEQIAECFDYLIRDEIIEGESILTDYLQMCYFTLLLDFECYLAELVCKWNFVVFGVDTFVV